MLLLINLASRMPYTLIKTVMEMAGFFALTASSIRFSDDEKNDDKGMGDLNKNSSASSRL